MTELRTTKAGVLERDGDTRWMSPSHQTTTEVDTPNGIRRRNFAGIRSPNYFGAHVGKKLTDKVIGKYVANGTYEARSQYLAEKRKEKAKEFLPRLVYDPSLQDFIAV